MSNIITSVDANVPVKGNRKAIGVMGNNNNGNVVSGPLGVNSARTVCVYNAIASDYIIDNNPTVPNSSISTKDRSAIYLSDNASESGIIGTVTRVQISCKGIIKY